MKYVNNGVEREIWLKGIKIGVDIRQHMERRYHSKKE